jgi:hypothetical protein
VGEYAEVRHAIVGFVSEDSTERYGGPEDADTVEPSELLESDVLVLDCEGAEMEILKEIPQSPQTIVVETHEFLDSPEEEVRRILSDRGYTVVDRGVELEEKGVYVLVALSND